MASDVKAERWKRLESAFHAAREAPETNRNELVRHLCEGDDTLLVELEELLGAFEESNRFKAPQEANSAAAASEEGKGYLREDVGGYELQRELGQGGMGTVYLARRTDGEFEQQVALKVVSAHLRTNFFTERFRAERQILANLNHPNITRLLDGGVSALGDPYLVMEYVDGETINRYCDKRLMNIPDRIKLFLQVCSAVEYAHRNLVVHRDLKPGNVLVTADGTAKLLDFGTAKLLMTGLEESTTTRFGAMTPRYASPEQLRGESVSTSMDVYSLGVMLYELVCGGWPFGDPNSPIAGLERAVREVPPTPPAVCVTDESARLRSTSKSKLGRILNGDLRNIVCKALEASPRRRYLSVEQLSADLSSYLEAKPVRARSHTWWYRGARFVQRYRWQMCLGVGLSAIIGVSGVFALRQYGLEQQRMAQVRELSQSYLTDVLKEVSKLPGSMNARLLIVDRARRNLDQLLPDAPGDPELRRALAGAYLQLGDIQGRSFTVSLGDTNGALLSYRKAETLARGGAANDWDLVAKLVAARKRMATIETRSGHYQQAIALLTSALEPARRLWTEAPHDLQFEGQPAAALFPTVHFSLGHAMLNANTASTAQGYGEALAQLKKTIAIAEHIQAEHPGMRDIAGVCSEYAGFALEGLAVQTGDKRYFQEAVAAHRRGQESTCETFEKTPDPRSQRNCADAFGELSWALHNTGEGEAAIQAAQRALALMEPVSAAEPNSLEAQQDLANAYNHLGSAENTAGKYQDALRHLRIAEAKLRPLEQVAADDPLETVKLYVDIQRQISQAQLSLHDAKGAVRTLQKGLIAAQGSAHLPAATAPDLRTRLAQAMALATQGQPPQRE